MASDVEVLAQIEDISISVGTLAGIPASEVERALDAALSLALEADERRRAETECSELRGTIALMKEALEAIEHPLTPEGGDMGLCAWCGMFEIRDHAPSCRVGAALNAARKVKTAPAREAEPDPMPPGAGRGYVRDRGEP